ncbi:MAG: retropepsin-like aspartic protease [Steroidobacteraceae bacterium]
MLLSAATRRWRPALLLGVLGAGVAGLSAAAGPPGPGRANAIGAMPVAVPMPMPMPRPAPGGFARTLPRGVRGGFNGRGFNARGFNGRRGLRQYRGAAVPHYYLHGPGQAQFAIATSPGRIGMIVAPVMLNGHGPFRFMIDTGATRTVLADSTLAKLDLKADPTARIIVHGVSGRTVVPIVHIASVDSGAMHFQDLSAPVLSGPVLNGLDGILGMDGLKGMTVSADFVHDRVAIGTSASAGANSMYSLRGQFVSQRLLMVQGRIGGVLTEAVIDTGATHSLGNAALLALLTHGHGSSLARTRADAVIDATRTVQPGTIRNIPSMQLGLATLSNLKVTFGDFSVFKIWGLQDRPALLLGMDLLGTVPDFSIDYRHAQLLVMPWPAGAG